MKISKVKSVELLKGSKGKFFSVTFIKKDGSERVLHGRVGVYKSKHAPLTGEGMKYNPSDYGLVTVFDAQKKAYRMVNTDTIRELTVDGETYNVS